LIGKESFAQVSLKIGIDTVGSYKADVTEGILTLNQSGQVVREPAKNNENANLGISLALEFLTGFRAFKFGLGVDYQISRELKDIDGYYNFISIYIPVKFELPLPLNPYLTGSLGVNILRGDDNYKSIQYEGISRFILGTEVKSRNDLCYGTGVGIPITKRYFLEAIYTRNIEIRAYDGTPPLREGQPENVIGFPHTMRAHIAYSKITVSLGYKL